MHIFKVQKNVDFRMICWSVFWKNYLQKGPVKPSVGCNIALLSHAQNSCSWRHNMKSKVHTEFITGNSNEIIK